MAQSSCKRDTKSKSHLGMKVAPVRVFSCKHPLRNYAYDLISCMVQECTLLIFNLLDKKFISKCYLSSLILINKQSKCSRTQKASYNDIYQYLCQINQIQLSEINQIPCFMLYLFIFQTLFIGVIFYLFRKDTFSSIKSNIGFILKIIGKIYRTSIKL